MQKTPVTGASRSVVFLGKTRQALGGLFQLGLVILFWLGGLGLSSLFGWPQLAGVVGMAALWLALRLQWVRADQIRVGASWLLTHMLLFFIPAVLVVLDHRELVGWVGLKLFAAIAIGTVIVMASTALSIEWCLRWSRRRQALARLRHAGDAAMSLEWATVAWSALTLGIYFALRRIYLRWPRWWSSPLLLAPVILIAIMLALHVGYREYISGTHWLVVMLGPVTVAFALPIHEHRELLRRYWFVLLMGALVGSSISLLSAWLLARGLALSPELQRSLMPRSVTTPFAITVSGRFGGLPDLTAAFVVVTGVCGAAIGGGLLRYLRLRSGIARGALFGMGAHGAGVAKAREIGEQEGTVAGLVMVLAGLLNLALMPLVGFWLQH